VKPAWQKSESVEYLTGNGPPTARIRLDADEPWLGWMPAADALRIMVHVYELRAEVLRRREEPT